MGIKTGDKFNGQILDEQTATILGDVVAGHADSFAQAIEGKTGDDLKIALGEKITDLLERSRHNAIVTLALRVGSVRTVPSFEETMPEEVKAEIVQDPHAYLLLAEDLIMQNVLNVLCEEVGLTPQQMASELIMATLGAQLAGVVDGIFGDEESAEAGSVVENVTK